MNPFFARCVVGSELWPAGIRWCATVLCLSLMVAAFWKMQGGSFFRGYTKLCKGLAIILLLVHLLVQLFPLALTYLALIPSRYQL
jgi:hypothetical protein